MTKLGKRPEPFFGPEDHDGISDPRAQSDEQDRRIAEWDAAYAKLTIWQKIKEWFS